MSLMINDIKIVRRGEGTYIKGIWSPGIIEEIVKTKASVQPVTGRDIMTFQEGEAEHIRFKIYFATPISLTLNDTIFWEGVEYKIMLDNNWNQAPFLKHTKVFIGSMKHE